MARVMWSVTQRTDDEVRKAAGFLIGLSVFGVFADYVVDIMGGTAVPWTVVVASVSVIVALVAGMKQRRTAWSALCQPSVGLWLLFAAFMTCSLLWSAHAATGATKLALFAVYGIIPGVAAMIVARVAGGVDWRVVAGVGSMLTLLVIAFGEQVGNRVSLAGVNPIWVGRAGVLLFVISAFASEMHRFQRIVGSAIGISAAFLTASRGPLIALAVGIGVIALGRSARTKGLKRKHAAFLCVLCLAACVGASLIVFNPPMQTRVGEIPAVRRLMSLMSSERRAEDENITSRGVFMRYAAEQAQKNILKGAGIGGSVEPSSGQYPHNIVLEIVAEGGLVGLTIWIYAVARAFMAARRETVLLSLLVVSLGFAMTSGDIGGNAIVANCGILALYHGGSKRKPARHGRMHLGRLTSAQAHRCETSTYIPGRGILSVERIGD